MVTPILYSYPYIVYNGILVPVRTSFGLHRRGGTMYQRKVDVDILNAVKSVLADVSSVSPSSELLDSDKGLMLETSANMLFMPYSISTSTLC